MEMPWAQYGRATTVRHPCDALSSPESEPKRASGIWASARHVAKKAALRKIGVICSMNGTSRTTHSALSVERVSDPRPARPPTVADTTEGCKMEALVTSSQCSTSESEKRCGETRTSQSISHTKSNFAMTLGVSSRFQKIVLCPGVVLNVTSRELCLAELAAFDPLLEASPPAAALSKSPRHESAWPSKTLTKACTLAEA